MRNLMFTIWMLCFYPAFNLGDYLESMASPNPHPDPLYETISTSVMFLIWIVTGILLFERKANLVVSPSSAEADNQDKAKTRR